MGLPVLVGSAMHEVAREGHRRQESQKAEAGWESTPRPDIEEDELNTVLRESLPSVEEAKDLAADQFDIAVKERGFAFGAKEQEDAGTDDKGKAQGNSKDAAVDLSAYYIETAAPAVNPVAVEQRVEVTPKGSDLTLIGYLDLVDELWDSEEVVDLKTRRKAPDKNLADSELQLTFYAMLRMAQTRRMPDKLRMDFAIRTPKQHKLDFKSQRSTRTKADLRELVHRLNVAHEAIRKGVFVPTDPNNWWCRFCEYHGDCRFTEGRRSR